MSTFVLVHGSFSGGWVWRQVAEALRKPGHLVFTPTLTGLGDRAHLRNSSVNLTTHVQDIASHLFHEDLRGVVLVGHSYGGIVISGVAATVPERLAQLIYLDAYVPRGRQSWFDLQTAEDAAAARAEMEATGLRQPFPASMLGISDPDLASWVDARMTPQPRASYEEPCPIGTEASEAIPRAFIRCTTGPLVARLAPAAAIAHEAGWPMRDLECGHNAMLILPDQVAEALLDLS